MLKDADDALCVFPLPHKVFSLLGCLKAKTVRKIIKNILNFGCKLGESSIIPLFVDIMEYSYFA